MSLDPRYARLHQLLVEFVCEKLRVQQQCCSEQADAACGGADELDNQDEVREQRRSAVPVLRLVKP